MIRGVFGWLAWRLRLWSLGRPRGAIKRISRWWRAGAGALALMLVACGPGDLALDEIGDETGGEQTEVCLEEARGTTCWSLLGDAWARTILDCEVESAVESGVWVPVAGDAECYEVAGSDYILCLDDEGLLLVLTASGWSHELSDQPWSADETDPPC